IRISLYIASAHPPAKLVHLRQTELICPIDDDGIDVGYIQPGLDNGGAHQDVGLMVGKIEHDVFQVTLLHLPVPYENARFRHQLLELESYAFDGFNSIVHKIHLTTPLHLVEDGRSYKGRFVFTDKGLDWRPVYRRCIDQ